MKHNLFKLYKGTLCMAIALLISQPLLAQPGHITPALPDSPARKVVTPKLSDKFIHSDIKIDLKDIDVQLAKLDQTLSRLEVRLAPKIALFEKKMELAFENVAQEIQIINHTNDEQPDANYVQAAEKTRTQSKSYTVDANDKLAINNQYGKVIINTWPRKEIKVDIEIKSYESSDSRAQEQLDGVSISESRQGDLISYKTNINKKNVSWWSRTKNGKEERRGVQINYVIYMPAKNPLDITNRYGSTELPNFEGPLNIVSSYGSFKAQDLENPANRVKVSYGSADIEGYSSGMLDVSYGSLKLTKADKLNADVRYSSAKIGRLTSGGNLDISYGDCKLGAMDKSVKSLIINSSYSDLTMGMDEASSFNFDVTVSYAGFRFNEDKVNITSKSPDEHAKGYNPTKNYKGTYGKGSDSKVIIKLNYGGVKFL